MNPWLLLATLITVWLADSAAYFAGKKFGKHKLAPEISPGKTWEGVAGALLAVTVYGLALCHTLHISRWLIAGLWLIVMLSVMGDLFESLLKRQAGVKDSSHLLPGHGGCCFTFTSLYSQIYNFMQDNALVKRQYVTILGATGTIGLNTLDVISQHPERFSVFALTANNNVSGMLTLCQQYLPKYAVMLQESAAQMLGEQLKALGNHTQVLHGDTALCEVSSHFEVDIVMAAIVGAAGLHPAMAAARAGKRVLLANKETLVMAGNLFMQAVEEGGATLLPIDSEHNAIFQVMPQHKRNTLSRMGVKRVLLTASGGPFRNASFNELKAVTREQALNHPNWVMGPKITIDSATMMNKGLEVIEAHWLFNALPSQIDVVVHPQSVIHSMVEYIDGSVLAQLGNPDMRTPIAYGLSYPERLHS
ncbi:unnamed protein product, partial [Darwinula stevensoni]